MDPIIRQASDHETPAIQDLVRAAFGPGEGPSIAALVDQMLRDPTACPRLSLVAVAGNSVIGHILFTKVDIEPSSQTVSASILAPLAVHPDHQRRGLGGRLIAEGLNHLRRAGTALVFVLGDPDYYGRHGFTPATPRGLIAPYPIAPEHADAWMVLPLHPNALHQTRGTIRCARSLDDPKHW